jgi:hypothetical protein
MDKHPLNGADLALKQATAGLAAHKFKSVPQNAPEAAPRCNEV